MTTRANELRQLAGDMTRAASDLRGLAAEVSLEESQAERDRMPLSEQLGLQKTVAKLNAKVSKQSQELRRQQLAVERRKKDISQLKKRDRLMRNALRQHCQCSDPDTTPPTDWTTTARIPHHCDCVLYPIELPHPNNAPAAYVDALDKRRALLRSPIPETHAP